MNIQLRSLALLLALVATALPAQAEEAASRGPLELAESLADDLDTLIVAAAAGSWDAVAAGVGGGEPPSAGRSTFAAASTVREFAILVDGTYQGLGRQEELAETVANEDPEALLRLTRELAFDGLRLQVSASVKDRMVDRSLVTRRMQVILDLYERHLAGLVASQAETTGGVGLHRKGQIEYYLEQLQSERVLGGDPASPGARAPRPSEFGQIGLWLLEELSKTLAWERPVGATGASSTRVDAELASEFERVATAVLEASQTGQWEQLTAGWQALEQEGAPSRPDLSSARAAGLAGHAVSTRLADLAESDHRRLLALGLAAEDVEKVGVALQALAYEHMRLQLLANLDARLRPIEECAARLEAVRSLYDTFFHTAVEQALADATLEETATQVRDGMAALELPSGEPKRVHVVQFGRDIVPVLTGIVRLLDRDVERLFAGSIVAAPALPESADKATRELFRQGEDAFARGDYESARDAFQQVASRLPGFQEVQRRLSETYQLLADAVGRTREGEQLLENPSEFVEVMSQVRAAAAGESWDRMAEGWALARDPVASRPEGAAASMFDLRNITAAVLAATGRSREPQVARALAARDSTDLDRMLRVLAFDAVRHQISSVIRSRLQPVAEARRRQACARELARWLLASVARGEDAPGEIVLKNASTAWDRLVETDLVDTPPEFEDDQMRLTRVRQYAQLGLTAVERLLLALRPTLSAARLNEGDGGSIRPPLGAELGGFVETATAVLDAAERGRWGELRLAFAQGGASPTPEGPGASASPAELARRLSLHHAQSKRAFAIDRGALFEAAFEAQDTRLLERAIATLSFDQLRILVTRNLRARLDPRPDCLRRVQEASEIYESLMRPFLVPPGSAPGMMALDEAVRVKLEQMASPDVLGRPPELVGLEGTSVPDIGAFGDLSTEVFSAAAQLLVRATQGELGDPGFREDDPEAFLELVSEVRRAVRRGDWEGLRAGFAGREQDAAGAMQPAAFQLGTRLAERARSVENEINRSTTVELERALVTRSLADIERMLALLAYDTCRVKISRNIGSRLLGGATIGQRGEAIRRIFETELATLVEAVVGLGEDAGERRVERVRSNLASMREIEAQAVAGQVTPQMVSEYGTHALEAVGELSAAIKLVDPGAIAMRREGKTARAQFRSDDPGAILSLLNGVRDAMRAGEWAELRAGFTLRSRDGTAELGYRLLDRCRIVDETYGETRAELVGRLLEIEQAPRLERVLTVLAFDTVRVKVLKNTVDGLRPAGTARARTQAIRSIIEAELREALVSDPGDRASLEPEPAGDDRVALVMEILAEMSSSEILRDQLDSEGEMAPEGDVNAYRTASLRLLKLLSGSIGRLPAVVAPPPTASEFRVNDPAAFLGTLDAVRNAGAEGEWEQLREGFEAGGEGSELDLPAVLAGRQLRVRADDVEQRFSQSQVESLRRALEAESELDLDRQILELAFNELRLKVSRNTRDLLTPYATARSRCDAISGIYQGVFQPLLDDAIGDEDSAAIGRAFARLTDSQVLGTDPAARGIPQEQPDPAAWGRAAAQALTRLNEGLGQVRLAGSPTAAIPATPERVAELKARFDSGSDDPYLVWAVDGLRVSIELQEWGQLLRGLQEGGQPAEGEPEAMVSGRVLRRAVQDIRRLFGTDHYPDLERAIVEQDRDLLNRLMVLMAYDIVRVRLNDNLSSDLQPLERVRERHEAVRALYFSVLRAAVLGGDKEEMSVARRMDQVVERALGQLDRPTVIGPRDVDKDAYRESARHVLQTLVRAISDPEKVVEGMDEGSDDDE